MSESSYADTSWTSDGCYGTSVSQKYRYDLVDIFDGHQLIDTVYSWDEIADRDVANSTSDKYTFTDAGDYTIKIRVREKWGTYVEVTKDVRIKYNEPTPDFVWTPTETNNGKIKGQEEITFKNTSSCLDDRLNNPYKYTWVIEDTNQDGSDNTATLSKIDYTDEPTHKFQSEGDKKIKMTIHWNDGFDDKEISIEKTIHIYPFDIVVDFHWDATARNRKQDIEFDPSDTTGDTDKISRYDWLIEYWYPAPDTDMYTFADSESSVFGEGSVDNSQKVDNQYDIDNTEKPVVKIHSMENKNIELIIYYDDGWKTVTKKLDKTMTPVKYSVSPQITVTNDAPQGRGEEVTHTNTSSQYSQDGFDLQYTIDWTVDDEYKECNLDNPDPGNITDNSRSELDKDYAYELKHNYQNTDTHTVELTIRYDDGYQMQTKRITKDITPIVYSGLVADFSWDRTPKGRDDEIIFKNDTTDNDNRYRSVSWVIEDWYDKYNPDNPDYGNSETDHTQTITKDTTVDLQPKHKFQSEPDNYVNMKYYYDDG